MSESNRKILVSGCGMSWSGQQRRTWVHVLRTAGADITDVGGPAVSNQWIINKAIAEASQTRYSHIFIQLTNLGKLDVEVDEIRRKELVEPDSLRNFTHQDVWPSSTSQDHESKKLYYQWLYSPRLETEDIACKLRLLAIICQARGIVLIPFLGYAITWSAQDRRMLDDLVDLDDNCWDEYTASSHWANHDHTNKNTVPCIGYQIELAKTIAAAHMKDLVPKIEVIERLHQNN